jgi:CDP-diacylglycerol---glycerol-3-phosphate 3-phosphatidyltransferase
MNLVNKITMSRIFIMPIFMFSLELGGIFWHFVALVCFGYATFSDWLDGYMARKYNCVTDFGKFMDPLADKIFVCAALIAFVSHKNLNIPAWMVTLILSREFLITGIRTLAVSKGVVLPAQKSGKYKTAIQLVGIFLIILVSLLYEFNLKGVNFFDSKIFEYISIFPALIMWVVVIFTTYSGIDYLYSNRKLIS